MTFTPSQQKMICVFGLGVSGISTAHYLQRINQPFFVVDSRESPKGVEGIRQLSCCHAIYLGEAPQAKLNAADLIVLSPGLSPEIDEIIQAKKNAVEVIGDIEIFTRQTKGKIIAITGSNGKSTVTDLTYQLLLSAGCNAKIGGNFGIPVLDFLPDDDADYYVLELSSFQLDTTYSLKADVAALLNITHDHLDRYKSFEDYKQSKLSIFNGAIKRIANADDVQTFENVCETKKLFSLSDPHCDFYLNENNQIVIGGEIVLDANQLSLRGKHNWSNVLAALAILHELNIEICDHVIQTLLNYKGLAHRFQLVCKTDKVEWINDSKATNVGATISALNSIDSSLYSKVILIAGGDAKGAEVSSLNPLLNEKISYLILIGKDAKMFQPLMSEGLSIIVSSMQQAVVAAKEFIEHSPDKLPSLVLLSPACASLDMFENYEARGRAFADAVRECA